MTELLSGHEQFDYEEIPPLGKIPDFDADERMWSSEAALVEHIPIDADPQLAPAFHDLAGYANEFQVRYGLESVAFDPSAVHVMSGENISRVAGLLRLQEENGGVYDTRADVMYVREPEQRGDTIALAHFNYAVSHELGHKLTSGLGRFYNPSDNSHILREGIADKFAKGFIHGVYLPKYAPQINNAITHQFAHGQRPYELEGVSLEQEDILTVDPATLNAAVFSRTFEAKVVQELEAQLGPDASAEMMQRATGRDILAVRQLVISQCGVETWDLLTADTSRVSPLEVLRELQE
jgi:hypothetical protein